MTPETGIVDLHSHLVPGVDDGAGSVEEALESIARLVAQGVTAIVTTPHLDASIIARTEVFERLQRRVEERWTEVTEVARQRFPELWLGLGREIMLDNPRFELENPALRLAGGTYVLVEFPRLNIPPGSAEALGHVRLAGYRPVVAHVERYHYHGDPAIAIESWCEMGAVLQVNQPSLLGLYGGTAESLAWRLLAEGKVGLLASDHHGRGEPYIDRTRELLEERGGQKAWNVLARDNPRRILASEPLAPVPAVELDEPKAGRMRGWIQRITGRRR